MDVAAATPRWLRLQLLTRRERVTSFVPALVAQGIEHRPPEPGAQVRILPRAPAKVVSDQRKYPIQSVEWLTGRETVAVCYVLLRICWPVFKLPTDLSTLLEEPALNNWPMMARRALAAAFA